MADPSAGNYGLRGGNGGGYGANAVTDMWNKRSSTGTVWDAGDNAAGYAPQAAYVTRSRDGFAMENQRGDYNRLRYGGQQQQPPQNQYGEIYNGLQMLRDEVQQLQRGKTAALEQLEETNQAVERRLAAVEYRQREVINDINRRLEKLEKVVDDMVQEIRRAASAGIPQLQQLPVSSTMYGISPNVVLRAHPQFLHPLPNGAPPPFGAARMHRHLAARPPPPARGPPRHDLSSNWPSSSVHGRLGPQQARSFGAGRDGKNMPSGDRSSLRTRPKGFEGGKSAKNGRGKQPLKSVTPLPTTKDKDEASTNPNGKEQLPARKRIRRRERRLRTKGKPAVNGAASTDTAAQAANADVQLAGSSGGSQLSNTEPGSEQPSNNETMPLAIADSEPVPMETQSSLPEPHVETEAPANIDLSTTGNSVEAI